MASKLQSHPLSKPVISFILAGLVVIALILWGHKRLDQGLSDLKDLQRRLQFSQTGPVAPSAAVLESLRQANEKLAALNASLDSRLFHGSDGPFNTPFPGNSTTAYFEIAAFVEEQAQNFKALGIGLADKNRFGFSEFEQKGPDAAVLNSVMNQKRAVEFLLKPLMDARPVALVILKREFLEAAPKDPTILQQAAGGRGNSPIRFADTLTGKAKLEGFESYTFELVFEGYSDSLRRFLKGIASGPLPIIVNGIEVRPLDRFGAEEARSNPTESSNPFEVLASGNDGGNVEGPVPIIRNNLSSFRLTLEIYCGKKAALDT